jgi:hypothetical protein
MTRAKLRRRCPLKEAGRSRKSGHSGCSLLDVTGRSCCRTPASGSEKNMNKKVVLMHGRHEAGFPTPGAELVFFNAPFNTERLARIEQVHLWSPPGDKLEALPEILREMRGLKTLSIGPGSIAPSIMDGLEEGLLPESIEALSIHLGTGTLAKLPRVESTFALSRQVTEESQAGPGPASGRTEHSECPRRW